MQKRDSRVNTERCNQPLITMLNLSRSTCIHHSHLLSSTIVSDSWVNGHILAVPTMLVHFCRTITFALVLPFMAATIYGHAPSIFCLIWYQYIYGEFFGTNINIWYPYQMFRLVYVFGDILYQQKIIACTFRVPHPFRGRKSAMLPVASWTHRMLLCSKGSRPMAH